MLPQQVELCSPIARAHDQFGLGYLPFDLPKWPNGRADQSFEVFEAANVWVRVASFTQGETSSGSLTISTESDEDP